MVSPIADECDRSDALDVFVIDSIRMVVDPASTMPLTLMHLPPSLKFSWLPAVVSLVILDHP
jgi:hypothetical protein